MGIRNTTLQMQHERAASEHTTKQRVLALRQAATAVASRKPLGTIQREVFDAIIDRLRADANTLENTLDQVIVKE